MEHNMNKEKLVKEKRSRKRVSTSEKKKIKGQVRLYTNHQHFSLIYSGINCP